MCFSLDLTAGEIQPVRKISDLMARIIEEAAYALRYNVFAKTTTSAKETAYMKCSRAEVHCKTRSLPVLRFEDSQLTSFSGLVLIQSGTEGAAAALF